MTPACGIGGGIGIGVSAPAARQAGYAAVFSQTQPLAARVAVAQPFHIRIVLPEER